MRQRPDSIAACPRDRLVDGEPSRRSVLKGGAAFAAGLSAPAVAFGALMSNRAGAADYRRGKPSADYGPLFDAVDENTGLPLLKLPKGFEYVSFGITGDTMSDGSPTPALHDGMCVAKERGRHVTLVRNHEQSDGVPFGTAKTPTYRGTAAGGTTNLVFDTRKGRLIEDWASLTGTMRNCAGGLNPLTESWITCEEIDGDPDHGFIFDVPAGGPASAIPIKDAGQFRHEAVAVDPGTGIIYETEDGYPGGFYRFVPRHPPRPEEGGKLQMARVEGTRRLNLNGGNPIRNMQAEEAGLPAGARLSIGQTFRLEWVDIADPAPGAAKGVVRQGLAQGGAFFTRGEGAWYHDGSVFWICTDGGEDGDGQLWEYDIRRDELILIFESTDPFALNNPDNVTVAPGGGILLCENSRGVLKKGNVLRGEQLVGLSKDGELFPFAENAIRIPAGRKIGGRTGDQRHREWAGATFSEDGQWLFANIQTPGITFAITGPWNKGALG